MGHPKVVDGAPEKRQRQPQGPQTGMSALREGWGPCMGLGLEDADVEFWDVGVVAGCS